MTAHTPAPWTVQKGAYGAVWAGPAQLPHPGRDSMRLEERMAERAADAALIAAAPDMLAALKVLEVYAMGGDLRLIRAAIAKAEEIAS